MTIAIGIAAFVVVAVLGFIKTRPATFRVERRRSVQAPSAAVFQMINDFHQWARWSPWERLDPNLTKSFGGPPTGAGATYAWTGNKKVGEGRMTILESKPNELIVLRIEFIKPIAATNRTSFQLVPTAQGTDVSWIMEGENTLVGKAMSAFVNMDALIGKDFERGLANLDVEAQKSSATTSALN